MYNKLSIPTSNNDLKNDKQKNTYEDSFTSYAQVKNLRMKKADFRNYIAKRYNVQIADKVVAHFDLSNQWT